MNKFKVLSIFLCSIIFGLNALGADSNIQNKRRATKNKMGEEFYHFSSYEEKLVEQCQKLAMFAERNADRNLPRFLFLAEAFGRLPLRILRELKGKAEIFVNDLSEENLSSFIQEVKELRESADPIIADNAKRVKILVGDFRKNQFDNELSKNFIDNDSTNKFDIIVANNVLHFF